MSAAAHLDKIRARALADPEFFIEHVLGLELEWFHRTWLRFCLDHPRHVLEAPRGFGKSTICTTGLILWKLCRDHDTRILIVSKTEGKAINFLREIRGFLESCELLRDLFGEFRGKGKWTDTQIEIAQRRAIHKEPTVRAVGLDGDIVGGHWPVIVVDDPFDEESSRSELLRDRALDWLFTTLQPTLMPGGSIGFRCTRYHYGDLAGRIEREMALDVKTGEVHVYRLDSRDAQPVIARSVPWKVLQTPAILVDGSSLWESRFPLQDRFDPDGTLRTGLATMRQPNEMGERRFGEQFLMICIEIKSGERETEFKLAWFRGWDLQPAREQLTVYQYVDPAFRSAEEAANRTKRDRDPDYYAIGILGFDYARGIAYVLDVFRGRLTPLERETKAKEYAAKWNPRRIDVERTGLQMKEAPEFYDNIVQALKPFPARLAKPQGTGGGKVARAQPLARAMDGGRLFWSPAIFTEYPALQEEFAAFPFGAHDDFVDAVSSAFLMGEHGIRRLSSAFQRSVAGSSSIGAGAYAASRAPATSLPGRFAPGSGGGIAARFTPQRAR